MNFSAREAGARIEGVVYGPSGNPVSNLDAWVYASEYSANQEDEFLEIIADTPSFFERHF